MLSEQKAVEKLKSGNFEFPPFQMRLEEVLSANTKSNVKLFLEGEIDAEELLKADWILELEWENEKKRFLVEYKSVGTPKKLEQGIAQLKNYADKLSGKNVLLMAPFLSEDNLERIRKEGLNAIDFSGNGIINVPGDWFVYRTGNENKYPTSAPIKNVYQGKSSLVGRVFFAEQEFEKVKEVKGKIEECGGEISLSTVSKVLKQMDEDMVIKKGDTIELIRPEVMLDNLSKNYDPPKVIQSLEVKIPESYVLGRLVRGFYNKELQYAAGGETYYGNLTESQVKEILYFSNLEPILNLNFYEKEEKFPNFEFREVRDQRLYFNTQLDGAIQFPRCSPVQTYLDLMKGGKREMETARRIRDDIILPSLKNND